MTNNGKVWVLQALGCAALGLCSSCSEDVGVRHYVETYDRSPNAVNLSREYLPAAPSATAKAGAPAGHAGAGGLHWHAPEGWTETAGGGMRLATFTVAGAECSIVKLPSGQDLRLNLDRWAGQLQLELGDEQFKSLTEQAPAFTAGSGWTGAIYDFAPLVKEGKKSFLVGIIDAGPETLFVKMGGPTTVLKEQAAAFLKLCTSIHGDSE